MQTEEEQRFEYFTDSAAKIMSIKRLNILCYHIYSERVLYTGHYQMKGSARRESIRNRCFTTSSCHYFLVSEIVKPELVIPNFADYCKLQPMNSEIIFAYTFVTSLIMTLINYGS